MRRRDLVLGGIRESGTVLAVAGLAGFYAATLIMTSGLLATMGEEQDNSIGMLLGVVSTVFIAIALYVSAVVMTGCVSTVIAGRLRQIATLRLLGADARSLRRSVCTSCAFAGAVGGAAGALVGVIATSMTRVGLVAHGTLPALDYALVEPLVPLVVLPVAASAWVAGLLGSRNVLQVSPAAAMTNSAVDVPTRAASRVRAATSLLLCLAGGALLPFAMILGEEGSASGFFAAFAGSALSAAGLLIGAVFLVPTVVRTLSRLLGSDATTRIARRNAVADPMRTTRSTLGLIVGVTLVTTFASGFAALRQSVAGWDLDAAQRRQADQVLATASTVLICIVVISCIMAAVGFVSTMSLTVIQRRREIGLLRSLGFTSRQVRTMITKESIALGTTASVVGIMLGLLYGSVGAQALIGSVNEGFVWGVPGPALAAIAVCAVILVLVAARPPARRAVRITPVEALRIEA
ncbi:FtsX-like permease family protein [Yimella sp. cx-51]|uniref:ABC transporter permease n=1 Tax=Yimella sp. cx-51 TaxID=2770551 RepID=UPI00165DE5CB|nr:FtsX-like permease family protein [Yimella sp. cx-51]MBC9956906.1 FtsX-like permease family protein [Yimella sp. cx-51]QTH39126.1 FtsX-like permease family protein [Yimella sp. cx-51]